MVSWRIVETEKPSSVASSWLVLLWTIRAESRAVEQATLCDYFLFWKDITRMSGPSNQVNPFFNAQLVKNSSVGYEFD